MTYKIRKNVIDPVAEGQEVERILREVMLTAHKDKLVKECSGGMKRKLSLAMALIGETKTIILDEPTSGLDVESRRQVWSLIRGMKNGRSVIMSTQHIEEADELSDRVCIMSHGKVVVLDTPGKIKKMFGVGYNVYVEPKHADIMRNARELRDSFEQVKDIFLQRREGFEGITESRDSTDKRLIFLVPIANVPRLSELIAEVEQRFPDFQIDIELNSLEDAYVKIAEDEIQAAEDKRIKEQGAKTLMSQEELQTEFEFYQTVQGSQSFFKSLF